MFPTPIADRLLEYLNESSGQQVTLLSSSSLGGGCINNAMKVQTSIGTYFLKFNHAEAYPGMFAAEASGLQLLAEANEIRIPEVVFSDDQESYTFLVLEYINPGDRIRTFWESFGKALASLHKHSAEFFGLDNDNYIGSLPQRNHRHPDWTTFFILERLEPLLRQARNKGEANAQLIRQFERLFSKLNSLIPPDKPALLHGDLWNGNYMVDEKGFPCLIDPAVYFGHREVDLAMTRLFGGFPPHFYESYDHAFPLEKGWEERTDVFNLYPLLVHVILFGGGYAADVKRILNHFV